MGEGCLDLNGRWDLRWSDGQRGSKPEFAARDETDPVRYIAATVPGEIHLDLIDAGLLDEPTTGTNVLAARWVEEFYWSYRRQFTPPDDALAEGARAWLVFDALDLAATVVLNGQEVGRHANAFYPFRAEITGKLRPGVNVLAVHIESGLFSVADKPIEGLARYIDHPLHKSCWLRKPPCQFGWDWAPRLANVGITGDVKLEWTSQPLRVDQFIPLATLSENLKHGELHGRVFVENLSGEPMKAELAVEVAGHRETREISVNPGLHPYEAVVTVAEPELWWPAGLGPQARYEVQAEVSIDGRVISDRRARVGFRHVRLDQSPHPQAGRYCILEVNGRRVFARGGNFVPADLIFRRIDRPRFQTLIERAVEANFNFLRVWGGGRYEDDEFYDLCDERGIMLWQEFIFACIKYPLTDKQLYDSARAEAAFNARRLASHPSLIAWCGNNELEWGAWDWGFDRGTVFPDYAFFHLALPRLMAAEDPTRHYQPSSPFSPDGRHPNADDLGDQHPWSVGMWNANFHDYRRMICRFPTEGGFLGPTALPTMLACLPAGQQFVQSFAWQIHDNAVDTWREPSLVDSILPEWIGRDTRGMSVEDYTYWGGLIHGEALSEYCTNFRRRMFDSASAIFWMFNDCWPATRSWTIVDYYLRRTPAFHPVRRSLAPIVVVVAKVDDHIVIFGVNDTDEQVDCELRYGVLELSGGFPADRRQAVTLPANSSTVLAELSGDLADPAASAPFAMLSRDGRLLARHRLFLPRFKELRWPAAEVRVRLDGGAAIFESDTFAWGVCLDLDGERALPDNFFDVYPGVPYALPWPGPEAPDVLRIGNLV